MNRALLNHETLGYGAIPVLTGVSLAIEQGEKIAILGRSGAGKSTLVSAVHARLTATGTRVALMPQDLGLVPQLSIVKNTLMGRLDDHGAFYNLRNLVRTYPADRAEISEILAELGLSDQADNALDALSGGQEQRVALARAFYRGGDILVGDEPFSALDAKQGAALLAQVTARFPTIVMALHDVSQALSFATRILGLRDGAIAIDAPASAVSKEQINALYQS